MILGQPQDHRRLHLPGHGQKPMNGIYLLNLFQGHIVGELAVVLNLFEVM